jgi:hypothetical protein
MEMLQLRYFAAVARTGNFNRAARDLPNADTLVRLLLRSTVEATDARMALALLSFP